MNAQTEKARSGRAQPAQAHSDEPPPGNSTTDLRRKLADAKHLARDAQTDDDLTDHQARAMLIRAARFLDEVITDVRERKKAYPPEMHREAEEILAEEEINRRMAQAVGVRMAPQKRPRRGHNPVVDLMRLGKGASALLHRILKVTNPDIVKLADRRSSPQAA